MWQGCESRCRKLAGWKAAKPEILIFGEDDNTPSVVLHIEFDSVYYTSKFFALRLNLLCINYDF